MKLYQARALKIIRFLLKQAYTRRSEDRAFWCVLTVPHPRRPGFFFTRFLLYMFIRTRFPSEVIAAESFKNHSIFIKAGVHPTEWGPCILVRFNGYTSSAARFLLYSIFAVYVHPLVVEKLYGLAICFSTESCCRWLHFVFTRAKSRLNWMVTPFVWTPLCLECRSTCRFSSRRKIERIYAYMSAYMHICARIYVHICA